MFVLPSINCQQQRAFRLPSSKNARFVFDVDVTEDELGLRLVRIGDDSPLRILATIEHMLVGVAEVGDSIVAINGVAAREVDLLFDPCDGSDRYEIAIFDHRTRRTVLWNLNTNNFMARTFAGQN